MLATEIWRRGSESNRRMMVLQTIPLGHLGTAPLFAMSKIYAQNCAQRAQFSPIYTQSHFSILLIPHTGWV